MYLLSAFVICLGGISLFTQKVYKLDKQKTIVELPFFGKLTTNYPALAFGFIGAAMAIYTFSRTSVSGFQQWSIYGSFEAPSSQSVQWRDGSLLVSPKQFQLAMNPDGSFEIQGTTKKGESFEDVVKQITYANGSYIGTIRVDEEYEKYKKGKSTCLEAAQDTTRRYKPVEIHAQ